MGQRGGTLSRLTLEQKDFPAFAVLPRYWVADNEVDDRLARKHWDRGWLLGWRSSDVRTVIASAIPRTGDPCRTVLNPPPGHGPRHPPR